MPHRGSVPRLNGRAGNVAPAPARPRERRSPFSAPRGSLRVHEGARRDPDAAGAPTSPNGWGEPPPTVRQRNFRGGSALCGTASEPGSSQTLEHLFAARLPRSGTVERIYAGFVRHAERRPWVVAAPVVRGWSADRAEIGYLEPMARELLRSGLKGGNDSHGSAQCWPSSRSRPRAGVGAVTDGDATGSTARPRAPALHPRAHHRAPREPGADADGGAPEPQGAERRAPRAPADR